MVGSKVFEKLLLVEEPRKRTGDDSVGELGISALLTLPLLTLESRNDLHSLARTDRSILEGAGKSVCCFL